MRVFLNELALAEAWMSTSTVQLQLAEILRARQRQPALRGALYCARGAGDVPTASGIPLSQAAQRLPRDVRVLLFEWIAKHGPFIDDDRQAIDEDLFFFGETDVTELGLGEAARRVRTETHASTFSPIGEERTRFAAESLKVVHGFPEEPIAQIDVTNFTDVESVVVELRTVGSDPTDWDELLAECRQRFDLLDIAPECDVLLGRLPYMPAAGRRIRELLSVLQHVKAEMDDTGRLSSTGIELRERFFAGKRAWFSDESPQRKQNPKRFTFSDPAGGRDIVCFWHGKVSTAALRMYFDWPAQAKPGRLRVVYIGPHI